MSRREQYVRYIQWFINFPILLSIVLFTSGLALSDILTTCFMSWVVVVCGLVGALTVSTLASPHIVHERRNLYTDHRWTKTTELNSGAILPIRIGLKQSNLVRRHVTCATLTAQLD